MLSGVSASRKPDKKAAFVRFGGRPRYACLMNHSMTAATGNDTDDDSANLPQHSEQGLILYSDQSTVSTMR
jgi:hypothetical protein